jgi:hypothetical protein
VLDDLAYFDADGEEGVGIVEGTRGVAVDQAGLPHAGLAQQQELDG